MTDIALQRDDRSVRPPRDEPAAEFARDILTETATDNANGMPGVEPGSASDTAEAEREPDGLTAPSAQPDEAAAETADSTASSESKDEAPPVDGATADTLPAEPPVPSQPAVSPEQPADDAAAPVAATPELAPAPTVAFGTVVATLRAITRRHGSVVANQDINLEIKAGELLALLGDNGAGKTTLINILAGHDTPDAGTVLVPDGLDRFVPLPAASPVAALKAGVATVHRPAVLAGNLTALENIMLGAQSLWRPFLPRRSARRRTEQLMQRLKVKIDLDRPLSDLSAKDRLYVAILRAFYRCTRVFALVLDEPTAALTPAESDALFRSLQALASDGLAVVFSSRNVDEALSFADRVAVLREGHLLADLATDELDDTILEALISDRAPQKVMPTFHPGSRPILELRKVDVTIHDPPSALRQASLEVKSGEIVGIAGIEGNGQDALVALTAGQAGPGNGEVYLFGRRLARYDTAAFRRAGISRIPKDRRVGAFASLSVTENLVLEDIGRGWLHRLGILNGKAIRAHARDIIDTYGLDCPDPSRPIATLPARTVERLMLFRMLDHKPHLIVADHPTHSLPGDLAQEVHRQLDFERNNGAAILLISNDIDELFALSDLICIIHRGRITSPQPTGAFDRMQLASMMGDRALAHAWAGLGDGT